MKRYTFLAISTALLAGCEVATAPQDTPDDAALSTSSTQTTYSGQATVLDATLLNLPGITLGDTGPIPETGDSREITLLTVSVPESQTLGLLALEAVAGHATTVAQGDRSRAEASVAELSLTVSGNTIGAGFLMSQAEAVCEAGVAAVSGASQVAELVVNGQDIVVTGEPNQTVPLPNGGRIIINEQSSMSEGGRGDITVTALHIIANDLAGNQVADIVIARAHADITCGRCNDAGDDFLTGGGWIVAPSGKRGTLAVAGGFKNGDLWGHLTYIDHGPNRVRVKGIEVTGYTVIDPTTRLIEGTAEVNGVMDRYEVIVSDKGEPGRSDTFTLKLLISGYTASGNLVGGNIQLHLKPSPCS